MESLVEVGELPGSEFPKLGFAEQEVLPRVAPQIQPNAIATYWAACAAVASGSPTVGFSCASS